MGQKYDPNAWILANSLSIQLKKVDQIDSFLDDLEKLMTKYAWDGADWTYSFERGFSEDKES
jgi:hypothetical protein